MSVETIKIVYLALAVVEMTVSIFNLKFNC